jgi:hypothetical protein
MTFKNTDTVSFEHTIRGMRPATDEDEKVNEVIKQYMINVKDIPLDIFMKKPILYSSKESENEI